MNIDVVTTVISAIATLLGGSGLAVYIAKARAQRRSVSKALLAEVHRLHLVIPRHYRWYADKENEAWKHPLIPFSSDVYDKHVENLGLVDEAVVGDIVKFFGYVKFINAVQASRAEDIKLHDGNQEAFNGLYVGTLDTFCKTYEQKFEAVFSRYGIS